MGLIAIPVLVYIAGRISERLLVWAYQRLRGDLIFEQKLEGDLAFLIVKSRAALFLDEFTLHLKDRPVDVLEMIRKSSNMPLGRRVQIDSMDRITLEFIIQPAGDKKVFIHGYLGPTQAFSEQDLVTDQRTALGFVLGTRMTIETSKKSYERAIFSNA